MDKWFKAALDYIPQWIELQLRLSEQPGCVIAIAHKDKIVLDEAFGYADLVKRETLTARHRFRIASHSKSFTAAGVMKLREQRKLKLDDAIGDYVDGVHADVAEATIGQLLSHSAGLVRDGSDAGQFLDRRPYLSAKELIADLAEKPPIESNTLFKYSNHGYGLIGLVIEAITGEPYKVWIKREIVEPAGLSETEPDMPIARKAPFARGHSARFLLGERVVIPGDYPTNAIASALGFVSTAADLARFYAQLSPRAKKSMLSVASRREMTRRQWRNQHTSLEEYYGFGVISGALRGWTWLGHSGALQGYISRSCVLPDQNIAISVLTNVANGWAGSWVEGTIHILKSFAERGQPPRKFRDWSGRWWNMGGPLDLVPMGRRVLIADPTTWNPFLNAGEIETKGKDKGFIALANGYTAPGESVRRVRDKAGRVKEVWLGGWRLQSEAEAAAEMRSRYRRVPTSR